jgi:low temperature requirement protein LtrA
VYFDFVARRPFRHTPLAIFFWPYLHLPLMAAITATGAGILVCVQSHSETLNDAARLLVTGAAGTSLIFIGLVETTLRRLESDPTHPGLSPVLKICCGAAMILLGLLSGTLKIVPILSLLLVLLCIQIVYGTAVWFKQEFVEH